MIAAFDAVRLAVPHIRPGGSVTLTSGTAAFQGGEGWFLGAAASRGGDLRREVTGGRARPRYPSG